MLALPLDDSYDDPQALFKAILEFVDGDDAFSMSHDELEDELQEQGRELMRRLLQRHLDRRAEQEPRLQVVDADGVERTRVEQGHHRPLKTVLGEVGVTRQAYRAPGKRNLYLADALLNLPVEEFSYGVRRAAAIEAAEGSYDSVVEGIQRQTGVKIGKRQVEELAARAAVDFNDFYARRLQVLAPAEDVLVISCDGKGIVMRPEALRDSTRAKAARASPKLKTRLSRGEKGNRKRMAEVGSVFDITPLPRSPTEILASAGQTPKAAPKARNKWVVASVIEDAAKVVHRVFDEAERRDPEHRRRWIALVDGQSHQIECIECTAARRNVRLTIVIDFVHVLEYLWEAAWSFFPEGDPDAEKWVHQKALAILEGKASAVAGALRRTATRRRLNGSKRDAVERTASYLVRKREHLDYPTALAAGWPIATGVIEGACRYLIKDRMDITGARWGLQGAEAVLKLRVLRANGDFAEYWRFHTRQERRRVHASRYRNELIPWTD